ncbi:NAD(P)/FAD-dependent oxidoreductase [Streptomyces sp. CNQ085]|uniref:FAD-dependent oxidoreductase n=1 Tax=Streptomyces sp. CNQ085 TaxID=2886944 RepID=UPI001F50FFBA|nr:NAD(P)/FAD-dependent oxidoreductase [Streptomyces sp. CNQ085]MCI0386311.1 FAD-dependent monooxygenase [Streptomyces sp. CNQ085]
MPDRPPDPTVCIVGAGPAGLLLALLLGRRGHRVTVLERSPRIDLARQAGAPVLQPVTLRILERLGLLERVRAGAGEIHGGDVYVRGRREAAYEYADLPGVSVPFALTVPVSTLRGALLEALGEVPGAEVRTGVSVEGLTGGPGRYRELVVRGAEGTEVLRPEFVVGCDGKFSAVRELAEIPTRVLAYEKGYLDFVVPAPPGWPPRITMHFGDFYLLSMPYPGDRLIVVWISSEKRVEAAMGAPFARLAAELSRTAAPLAPLFPPQVAGLAWEDVPHRHVRHHMVRPERWLDGNVLLIGDSAHAMHAFGGQGLNTSLQDAVWAADGIEGALRERSTRRLREHLRTRVPFVESFQLSQRTALAPGRQGGAEPHGVPLPDFMPMVMGQPELRSLWEGTPQETAR